jgi:hypothetical protein
MTTTIINGMPKSYAIKTTSDNQPRIRYPIK